jgi:SpoVK/Ycf46/Vps4 family AAA+-type ATPase
VRIAEKLDVAYCEVMKGSTSSLERLQIPEESSKMLKALVQSLTKDRRRGIDFIEGRGQGRVVLLHGPPGVGKTLVSAM